jgi:hypothetical protein
MTFVYAQPQLTIVALSNSQWHTSSCSALLRSLATSAIWRRRVGAGPIGLGLLGDMLRVQVGSKLSIEIGLDFESDHFEFRIVLRYRYPMLEALWFSNPPSSAPRKTSAVFNRPSQLTAGETTYICKLRCTIHKSTVLILDPLKFVPLYCLSPELSVQNQVHSFVVVQVQESSTEVPKSYDVVSKV